MWPIDSSLDESMKEQVLTMTTSAFSASGMTVMPAWCKWPTMISLSTRFLAQPREMRLTLIMAIKNKGAPGKARASDEETGQAAYFLALLMAALRRALRRLW